MKSFVEWFLSQFSYVHLLKERARLIEIQRESVENAKSREEDKVRDAIKVVSSLKNDSQLLLTAKNELHQKCIEQQDHLDTLQNELLTVKDDGRLAWQERDYFRSSAEKWEGLYLKEVESNKVNLKEGAANTQHALELVADWEAQRMFGRQIFHHAPLLQPDKPAVRQKMPINQSARDAVRAETQAFYSQEMKARASQGPSIVRHEMDPATEWEKDRPGDKFFVPSQPEAQDFFESVMATGTEGSGTQQN